MSKNDSGHSITEYARQGDELIRFDGKARAKSSDFQTDKTVILIHGFTAHGDYLESLATELIEYGYNVLIYNYYSLNGVLRAAESLAERLVLLNRNTDGDLESNKVSLICHSMGGLVGKSLYLLTEAKCFVSSLVTIGTPHQGTLTDAKVMQHLINAGEYLSGSSTSYRPDSCSAKELMGVDNYNNIGLLDSLTQKADELKELPILSISGGRRYLEVGSNQILNYAANKYIQKQLKSENDGLVLEDSSTPFSNLKIEPHPLSMHQNKYSDYKYVNHSHLVNSQVVGLNIVAWLNNILRSDD
ncbi:alpha/beta hydrolase [Vibrio splendidus]|uniref:alpha/beta hydrolase n=1 Tax=Vibrio splendidus TaxID=29497 RepID=UPI000E095D2C|nr:alpha/beta hydrolase [Vibrio splendidus]